MAPTNVQFLRWPRYIFFLLTTALCIATIGLAAWSLSDSKKKEQRVGRTLPGAELHIMDIRSAGAAVAAASATSALLCLVLLVFQIVTPRRVETLTSIRVKEGLFAFCLIFLFAALVPATLFCAQRSGSITAPGIPQSIINQLVRASGLSLAYKENKPVLSFVVVGWIALLSTLISLILVSLAARKAKKHHAVNGGYSPDVKSEMISSTTPQTPTTTTHTAHGTPAIGGGLGEDHTGYTRERV